MNNLGELLAVLVAISAAAMLLRAWLGVRRFLLGWAVIVVATLGGLAWSYGRTPLHDHTLVSELASWGLMLLGVALGCSVFATPLPAGKGGVIGRLAGLAATSVIGFVSFVVGFIVSVFLSRPA